MSLRAASGFALLLSIAVGCGPMPDGSSTPPPPPGGGAPGPGPGGEMGDGPPGAGLGPADDPHDMHGGDMGGDPDPRGGDPDPRGGDPEPKGGGDSGDVEPSGELAGFVAAHNKYRNAHCAPPLKWSDEIAAVAAKWGEELVDRGCAFEHSPGMEYGENLAYMSPAGIGSPESVTEGWYRELDVYDWSKPGFSFEAGHFTQVVWVGTTEVGCARAVCRNAEIWVCNYSPPGNFQGQFKRNVLPTSCK